MTGKIFVDTNVLVYARDASEPDKQPRAAAWMEHLWRSGLGRLSLQVLQEYYVTVTRKLKPGLEQADARLDVRNFLTWHPISVDGTILEEAWVAQDRFGLSWWDALIVSAAQATGCQTLLSEDFQDGQSFDGLKILSPFLHDPPGKD